MSSALAPVGHQRPHGVDDLGPAAVVEGEREGQRAVVPGQRHRSRPARRMSRRGTRQSRRPAKRTRTPRSFSSSRRRSRIVSVEPHEVAHLVDRAAPVLGREGVDGEPLDAELERALDRVEQGLLAGGVAVGALEAPLWSPTARCRPSRRRRGVGMRRRSRPSDTVAGAAADPGRRRCRDPRTDVTAGRAAGGPSSTHPPVRLRPMGGDGDSGARRTGSGRERSGRRASAGAGRPHPRSGHRRAPGHGEPRSGQVEMAEAVARGRRQRPAPRGAGGHRHRQVPRLPRARPSSRAGRRWWPPPPRRCRTSWPPRTCRSWPSTSTSTFACGGAEGAVATTCASSGCGRCATGVDGQLELRGPAPVEPARGRAPGDLGRPRPPPATGPSWTGAPATGRGPRSASPARSARAPSAARSASPASPRRPGGRAAAADVVVVNTHLYGIDVGSRRRDPPRARGRRHRRGPPAGGHHLGHGRAGHRRRPLRRPGPHWPAGSWPTRSCSPPWSDAGTDLGEQLAPWSGQLLPSPLPGAAGRVARPGPPGRSTGSSPRCDPSRPTWPRPTSARTRAQKAAATLAEDLDAALVTPEGAGGVGRGPPRPAPPGGGAASTSAPVLSEGVWSKRTAILTSATIPINLPDRVGLPSAGDRPARRRQPVRLRGARAPLLRRPPARPAPAGPPGRGARRAAGPHRRRRRPHARPVHQPAGDAGGGGRAVAACST